jgi:ankyrin repeat protein
MDEIMSTLQSSFFEAVQTGTVANCQYLIAEGADVNARNASWFFYTPLHYAARAGRARVCRILLVAGALVDPKCTKDEETPLHMAAAFGNAETCSALLKHGANVHAQNQNGSRPLYDAASAKVAQLLLRSGAGISDRNHDGYTALHGAALHNRPEVCRALVDAGADACDDNAGTLLTPLQRAVSFGAVDSARYFIDECRLPVDQVSFGGEKLLDMSLSQPMDDLLLGARSEQALGDVLSPVAGESKAPARSFSPI